MIVLLNNRIFHYCIYSLCLVGMVALIVNIVLRTFILGSRENKMHYLKSYKKGKFALIYLISIPLFFLGYLYETGPIESGTEVLLCFFDAICAAFDLVKLDFGMSGIVKAMLADNFYYFTMIVCYIVTVFNVLMFSASLLWQRIKNLYGKLRAYASNDLYIVVGDNNDNILLLNSLNKLKNKRAKGIMLAMPDSEQRDKLYLNGISYISFNCIEGSCIEFYKKIKSLLGFRYSHKLFMKKNVSVIVNTSNDERNLLYVKELEKLLHTDVQNMVVQFDALSAQIIEKYREKRKKINLSKDDGYKKEKDLKECDISEEKELKECRQLISVPVNARSALVTVYTFSKVKNQQAFYDSVKNSCGHIRLLNRYEQIAFDFVDRYPLTRFMTEEHIDYTRGLIKKDTEINVCFVGFGRTNRQIFLKTISNAQFFAEVDGKIVHKKVHYYVYDKSETYKDKNLNQTYFRYSLEFYKEYRRYREEALNSGVNEGNESWNYLPLPDYPADDWFNPQLNGDMSEACEHFKKHFCKTDINSYDFYDELKNIVCKKNSYTYIVVAFGKDLENIDLSKKISARLKTWGKSDSTHIFVKVRSDVLAKNDGDSIIRFGSTRSVYDLNKIVDNPIQKIAYFKSFKYTRSSDGNAEERRRDAVKNWMRSSPEQKLSNFYCCLNLRTKLNLLGLDYVKDAGSGRGDLALFYDRYYGKLDVGETEPPCNETVFCDGKNVM